MSLPVTPSISIRNILFATDFSSCSKAALPHAVGFSGRYDGLLDIVSVVPAEFCYSGQPPDPFYFRHSAEQQLARLVASGIFQGIKHREFVLEGEGDIPLVLTDVMRKLAIDLVVMGTHGRGGVKKVLLGSTSEEIVYSAPCPVLTIGPHVVSRPIPELKPRKILCAADMLSGSGRAQAYVLWLAEHEGAQVALLHISNRAIDRAPNSSDGDKDSIDIKQTIPAGTSHSNAAEPILEAGSPVESILKAAEGQSADLIVMGLHSTPHPRVSAHLPWVTTHQVLCRARCPVLTVRE